MIYIKDDDDISFIPFNKYFVTNNVVLFLENKPIATARLHHNKI